MQRSTAEMATLLDALLLIARSAEATDASATVELGPALASVVAEFRAELDGAHIQIGLRCAEAAHIQAPPDLLRVALRLLFRSIASGAYGMHLRLDADARGIVLGTADAAALHGEPAAGNVTDSSDAGVQPAEAVCSDTQQSDVRRSDVQRSDVRRSDEMGGIGMLRRLCQRYGWSLELAHDPAQASLLSLRFWSADAAPIGVRT